jgi:hypothetical protein
MQLNWTVILSWLAVSSTLFGALAWFTRSVIGHLLSRDLERFKANLEYAALEHQIQFSHLHEKRAAVVAELYEKLLPAKQSFAVLKQSEAKDFSEKDRKLAHTILESCLEAFRYTQQHALISTKPSLRKFRQQACSSLETSVFMSVWMACCLPSKTCRKSAANGWPRPLFQGGVALRMI